MPIIYQPARTGVGLHKRFILQQCTPLSQHVSVHVSEFYCGSTQEIGVSILLDWVLLKVRTLLFSMTLIMMIMMQYVDYNQPRWKFTCVSYNRTLAKPWEVYATRSKRIGSYSCGPLAAVSANAGILFWKLDKPMNLAEAGLGDQVRHISTDEHIACKAARDLTVTVSNQAAVAITETCAAIVSQSRRCSSTWA